MAVDLTIYLMRTGTKPVDVVQSEKLTSGEFHKVTAADGAALDFPTECYVKVAKPSPTKWGEWLGDAYDFGSHVPKNQSSGCLLVLRVSNRVFALAFGTGRHAINPERIEYEFGLGVALQKVRPDRLHQLVSKTVDVRTREKSIYHHAGGPIGDFSIDLDTEWVRSVSGGVQGEDFSAVAGTDAIRLTRYTGDVSSIASLCRAMLAAFRAATPEAFEFTDNIRPISKNDPKHDQLETYLVQQLDGGIRRAMEVIVDRSVMNELASARVRIGRSWEELADLSTAEVWRAADQVLAVVSGGMPSKIKVEILDESAEVVRKLKLLDVLQAEVQLNGSTYLRLERRWFAVSTDYIQQVDDRIRRLPVVKLGLPTWDQKLHPEEGDYNAAIAAGKGWLLQDKQLLRTGKGDVEPCDLLTEDAQFIHVKNGTSSAHLNHLFGQLSASAELYARHSKSRTEMEKRYKQRWQKTPLRDRRPTFIAAIGRKQVKKDLLGRMLVAKVNLLDHAKRIKALDYDFALAGFQVKPAPTNKKK